MAVTDAEISSLAATHDIIAIGMEADAVRREKHGNKTTFIRVATVDVAPGAEMAWPAGAGEIRIAGVPPTPAAAAARVREVVERAKGTPVSAFSLADLEQLAIREKLTLRAILEDLRAVGLDLVAEAPFDELQDARRSIEEVNIAGLALARLTVSKLPSVDTLSWLKRIAELQYTVGVVRAFAPLPRKVNAAIPTTGYDDVKRVALARLAVSSIPSIQVDWSLYGPKLAQVALTVGADDVDAVSADDDASQGRRRAPLEEILRNIRAAGQEPVERNGRFETLNR
jgi:aminodeoxyfutalosine synthase